MIFSKGQRVTAKDAQRARALAERRWNPFIRKYTREAFKALSKQTEDVISYIEKSGVKAGVEVTAVMAISPDPIKDVIDKIYTNVSKSFFDYVRKKNATRKNVAEIMFFQQLANYVLQTRATKVKEITETTRKQLKEVLAESVAQGLTIQETAKKIRGFVRQTYRNRAATIARTEVIGAANFGQQKGAESLGLNLVKVWVAQLDGRERPAHRDANMDQVGLTEQFEVGGQMLDYPHDLSGSAKNVINCRCSVIYQEL